MPVIAYAPLDPLEQVAYEALPPDVCVAYTHPPVTVPSVVESTTLPVIPVNSDITTLIGDVTDPAATENDADEDSEATFPYHVVG
jgi:hypothetical protein